MHVRNYRSVYYWLILMICDHSAAFMMPFHVPMKSHQGVRYDNEISPIDYEDCNNKVLQMYCTELCGEIHACVLGKCFCAQPSFDSDNDDSYYSQRNNKRDFIGDMYTDREAINDEYNVKRNKRVMFGDMYVDSDPLNDHQEYYPKNIKRNSFGDRYEINEPADVQEIYYPKKKTMYDPFGDNYKESDVSGG